MVYCGSCRCVLLSESAQQWTGPWAPAAGGQGSVLCEQLLSLPRLDALCDVVVRRMEDWTYVSAGYNMMG